MCMGQLRRQGRPHLILAKHRLTRRYLNLDSDGHAYRYVQPRRIESTWEGRYVPLGDLVEAIDHLELYELPWMCETLDHQREGLTWEQRWNHPDAIAWRRRRDERVSRRAKERD